MGELSGQAAIVTGAAGGIGRAVTLRLAREGADVLAVDLRAAEVEATAAAAEGFSGRVIAHAADVTKPEEVRGYVDVAVEAFGRVELFHNNAGVVGPHTSIVETALEEWDLSVAVNLNGVFYGLKYVLPAIKKAGGGAVVVTGSVLSLKGAVNRAEYVATKHGALGLARTAAAESAADGIVVNCICPGPIETPMMELSERLVNPADPSWERERLLSGIPAGRYGHAEEIAELVAFLLSRRVPYLNGAVVSVDGGLFAV